MLTKVSILVMIGAVVYGMVIMSIFPGAFVIDDVYITFRYADNLALHGELTWNVGDPPVEGYTGVVLPVLIAGAIRAGVSPLVATRAIGIASFWLSFLMLFLIGRRLKVPPIGIAGSLLIFVTTPILITHTFSGMDTMLFLSMMLSSIFAFISKKDRTLLVLLLLTSLVRPEGVAFSFFTLIVAGWERYRASRAEWRKFLMQFLFIYFLPAIAYFLWRVSYYGKLMPNTFYAKSGIGFQIGTLIDLARFLRRYFAVPLLGVAVLVSAETDVLWEGLRSSYRAREGAVRLIFAALFSLTVIGMLLQSHLTMNFSHRFYTMLFPVVWVFFLYLWKVGFSSIEHTKGDKPIRYRFVMTVFFILILYQSAFQVVKVRDEVNFAKREVILLQSVHMEVGKELKKIVPISETLIVYMDAGIIPYISERRTIDFGDLNDSLLASHTLSPSERVDYFFSHKAAAVVITSINHERIEESEEAIRIVNDPRFRNYVLYKRFAPSDPAIRYYEFVYLRNDLYEKLRKEGKISKEI